MQDKSYKLGLVIGRFQPLHSGHEFMIRQALNVCEEVVIIIGSAQESRTKRNPLTLQERTNIIVATFADEVVNKRIKILGLNDREKVVNDSSWGEYVLNALKEKEIETPDCVVEGNEPERETWYDSLGIQRFIVDRNQIKISGTRVREMIENDEFCEWVNYCPSGLYPHKHYDFLQKIIKEIK